VTSVGVDGCALRLANWPLAPSDTHPPTQVASYRPTRRQQSGQLRGGPRGALLDGVLDRVGDGAILAGLGLWALDGRAAEGVLVLTVAATTGALLSMASKDRAAALGLPPAPERALGWLLGGRDGRLLLVAVGALLGAPLATLAAVTATSTVSLGLRVAFLRRPPATYRQDPQ